MHPTTSDISYVAISKNFLWSTPHRAKKTASLSDATQTFFYLSTHTETGQKRSLHGEQWARKSDHLVSHGNMHQCSKALINPNSNQGTDILKCVCLLSTDLTKAWIQAFTKWHYDVIFTSGWWNYYIHITASPLCFGFILDLFWLRNCHSAETDGQVLRSWELGTGQL